MAFRTCGGSLDVERMAARAARVFDAIHDGSKLLLGVRAPAPVRAEAPERGDPLARFTIAGFLKGAAPLPTGTPTASKAAGSH